MTYKIVMDSSSNILELDGVDFGSVPLKIVTDQREFCDDANLDLPEMLSYLAAYKGRSGSSCPSVGEWLDAFGDADCVFALSITGTLSGCYNSSVQAAQAYEADHPGRRVCCIDTLSTGPEMILLAEKLRDLIVAGKDFDTVEGEIRDYMTHTHLIFTLESLDNMCKNGRVSPLIAKACGLLGIRIVGIASAEGTLQPLHRARGEAKALAAIVKEIKNLGYQGGRIRMCHCRNEKAAEALKKQLEAEFPGCTVVPEQTRGLCSFYAEEGGILLGFDDLPA